MRVHDLVLGPVFDDDAAGAAFVMPELVSRWRDAEDDFLCALVAVRLRGTEYVTEAAEEIFAVLESLQRSNHEDDEYEDAYQAGLIKFNQAHKAFLEAARHDLAYNPKRWQLLRRWRERQYRKARAAVETPAVAP